MTIAIFSLLGGSSLGKLRFTYHIDIYRAAENVVGKRLIELHRAKSQVVMWVVDYVSSDNEIET